MKLLQINCVYREGSTGKLVYELHKALEAEGTDSVVCYGRGQRAEGARVYKTCGEWYAKANNLRSRFTGLMYGGCRLSTRRLISIIRKEKPDVVHLHCINGYFVNIYALVAWLKKEKIRTILTLHAEFMYTGNCGHALDCERWKTGCGQCPRRKSETKSLFFDRTHGSWLRMKKAFEGFRDLTVVSVSPWLMDRAKQAPILSEFPHQVILNGVDTEIFRPCETAGLRKELGLEGKQVVFHTTAEFSADPAHLKGGCHVLELARRMPETVFLVAGTYDQSIVPPENLRFLGKISDQRRLAAFYSMADACVLTSKRETFSMLVAESLCCGTPVLGFEAGGPEGIAVKEFTKFVPQGDIDGLLYALKSCLKEGKSVDAEFCQKLYGKDAMCAAYVRLYHER